MFVGTEARRGLTFPSGEMYTPAFFRMHMLVIVQFFVTFLFVHAPSSFFFPLSGPHFSFENGKSRKCVFASFLKREREKDREKKRKVIGIFGNPTCRLFAFGKRYPSPGTNSGIAGEPFSSFYFLPPTVYEETQKKKGGTYKNPISRSSQFRKMSLSSRFRSLFVAKPPLSSHSSSSVPAPISCVLRFNQELAWASSGRRRHRNNALERVLSPRYFDRVDLFSFRLVLAALLALGFGVSTFCYSESSTIKLPSLEAAFPLGPISLSKIL